MNEGRVWGLDSVDPVKSKSERREMSSMAKKAERERKVMNAVCTTQSLAPTA